MKHFIFLIGILALTFFITGNFYAQVPNKISYQGLLTNPLGSPVPDGNYDLQFDIYNLPSGGTLLYTETLNNVSVQRGTFSVILRPPSGIFAESLFVEVTVLDGPGISSPITFSPRSELSSAPYAFRADTSRFAEAAPPGGNAGGDLIGTYPNPYIKSNAVTSTKIATGAVEQNHIALYAVGSSQIAPNAVTETKIGNNAITSNHIQDGTILFVDIGTNGASANQVIKRNPAGTAWIAAADDAGMGGSGSAGYLPKFNTPTTLGNSSVYNSGVSVGIGTTAPSALLDVNGDAKIASTLRLGSGSNLTLNPASYSITSTSELNMSSAGGGMTFTASGGSIILNPGTGSSVFAGGGGLIIPGTGDFQLTKAKKGGVVFVGTSGKYRDDSTKFFWDSTNARLGIGNSVPAYPLDVTGDINTSTKYRIGGTVQLDNPGLGSNLFVGGGAGVSNIGNNNNNTFVGVAAGGANTNGFSNTFVGNLAGAANIIGQGNSFLGYQAGNANTGNDNTFIGFQAGQSNGAAHYNTFVGGQAGKSNLSGANNAFFGKVACQNNTSGNNNVAVGVNSGVSNTIEDENTFIGYNSDGMAGITNATAVGSKSKVMQSNSLVLGSINGLNGAGATVKVGIGTPIPNTRLDVAGDLALQRNINPAAWIPGIVNNDVNFGEYSFVQINGGGGTLNSVANPKDGKILIIYCSAGGMTIANNMGPTPANQIRTMSGGNINIIDEGSITLVYSTGVNRWIVTSFMP